MKSKLLMDFSIDKETSTVKVKREFAAAKDVVWSAWTESEILDEWWAPKPWKARTKSMDFKVGGHRLYAMVGPEGEEHWAWAEYTSITVHENFKFLDAFCDAKGNLNPDFPRSDWNVDFTESNGSTVVLVEIKHEKLSDLEMIIEMGFKEGFTMALENLDDYIKMQKLKNVDEYIRSFPEDVQTLLNKVREAIKKKAPKAVESISYGMPAYKVNGKPLVYFSGFKNHIGFYATPSGHAEFADDLSKYKQGKGSVQFPLDSPVPFDLIERIVAFRLKENLNKKPVDGNH